MAENSILILMLMDVFLVFPEIWLPEQVPPLPRPMLDPGKEDMSEEILSWPPCVHTYVYISSHILLCVQVIQVSNISFMNAAISLLIKNELSLHHT